ncbi:MAG: hypothetical protein ACPG9K_00915 [Poseidonibacter sp.]
MKFNFYRLLDELDGNGNDLGGGVNNDIDFEKSTDPKVQEIIDAARDNEENHEEQNGEDDDIVLPSDNPDNEEDGEENNDSQDKPLFAGKYKTVDDLKNGIKHLKSELPQYILDGMNDAALEQHYKELNKNFSGSKEKRYSDNKDEKPEIDKDEGEKQAPKLDDLWNELKDNFKFSNKISDEMYNSFKEAGIPDSVVDTYADGLLREQVDFTNKVLEISGGEDEYKKIKEWAEENYSQAELDSMTQMDYSGMLMSVRGIKAEYDKSNGSDKPKDRIRGNSGSGSNGSMYKDNDDYLKDVSHPKYGKDKRYTQAVESKFKRSKL